MSTETKQAIPSDEVIAERVKNAGAIEVRFTSDQGTLHQTPLETYYERTVESKWKTNLPDVFRWERSDNRYNFIGNEWVFDRSYFGYSWMEGVENPTMEEIEEVMERSEAGYQGVYLEKPVFRLPEDPKWEWKTLNSVEFQLEVTYWKKWSNNELQKVCGVYSERFFRDCGEGQYVYNAKEAFVNNPWLNVSTFNFSLNQPEVLETKILTDEEAQNLKSLWEIKHMNG